MATETSTEEKTITAVSTASAPATVAKKPATKPPVKPTPAKATPAKPPVAKTQPAAKQPVKKPAPAKTPVVKPAAASAKPMKAVAKAVKPEKHKKPKLVRDSFTIPKDEYELLGLLKARAINLKQPAKKSEVLRAGIKLLANLKDAEFLAALSGVPSLKTGRPASNKAG
jgi:hypothetical protein